MEEKNNFKHSLKFTTHDISTQQKEMKQFFHGLNDKYLDANSLESKEYFSYLASAIYLTCKDLYPDLSIYIPFRIKSDNSTQKNYPKEFHSGITEKYNSQENELDLTELVKDFLAATVVLDHVKNSRKTNVEYVSNNIDEYRKLKEEILDFVNDADEELNDFIDEKKYIELKMKTLELLSKSTYPECSNERTITYDTERKEVKKSYDIKSKTDDFMPYITEDQVKNLKNLLLDLRSRSSDKLEFEILKEILPNVFNAPLIKNALKVDFKFEKEVKKPNGFVAIYYTLSTPFGIIEIQSQSNKRYYESKKGSAFHSGILGKEVDITSFFELVDENDNRPLNFYLSKLDNINANQLLSDVEIPEFKNEKEKDEFLNGPYGKNYLLTLEAKKYMSHIKIKDNYTFPGTDTTIDTDEYLLSLAKSISPFMAVCSSGHTSFATASIHQKDLIGEFTEILRKKDSTSCLSNILIHRLKDVIRNKGDEQYTKSRRDRDLLPKDVAKEDIVEYSESLHKSLEEKENSAPVIE